MEIMEVTAVTEKPKEIKGLERGCSGRAGVIRDHWECRSRGGDCGSRIGSGGRKGICCGQRRCGDLGGSFKGQEGFRG